MQTFLPLPSFAESVATLHNKHLGGQLNECYQLLIALTGLRPEPGPGWESRIEPVESRWRHHTVARQWKGHEIALSEYLSAVLVERAKRGMNPSDVGARVDRMIDLATCSLEPDMPPWLGDERFHASHRSNLLRKDASHYSQFGWAEPDDLPYFYPHGMAGAPGPYHPEVYRG